MPADAVVARVVATEGFSDWPGGRLAVIAEDGQVRDGWLGEYGAAWLAEAAARLAPGTAVIETMAVKGRTVADLGLTCGGQADVLLQPWDSVPPVLWERLAARAPVALITILDGTGASVAVDVDGRTWPAASGWPPAGFAASEAAASLVEAATGMLAAGRPAIQMHTGDAAGSVVEAWVPAPRLVTVGSGALTGAIAAQAGLLGWETQEVEALSALPAALDWAGVSASLIVLSHDPHVDGPSLTAGLERKVAYVGALGSRATQARRTERMLAAGVPPESLARIHRPIGLDLGGRGPAEVAMAICAEILAVRCGRDGSPLTRTTGPINDRPTG